MPIVLDYTTRIPPQALKDAGVIGACRYLSWPSASWKVIGRPEYQELLAADISVTLNWEFDAHDWARGELGGPHGTEAVRQARILGYPAGSVIVGSADFDMSRNVWDSQGQHYARSFAQAVRNGGYRPGVYGPWDVLQWVKDNRIMDAFWQAGMSTAWSQGRNAGPWPGFHLRQRGHRTVGGVDTDWNDVTLPLWGSMTVGKREDEEPVNIAVVKHPDGNVKYYVGNGVYYTDIITGEELNDRRSQNAAERNYRSDEDWQGWVGRTRVTAGVTANVTLTPEQVDAAVAKQVDAIAKALAAHFKVV
jgi:hypothetical protein